MENKKSFVFYESWYEVLEDERQEVQWEVIRAVMEYVFNDNLVELKPNAKMAFKFIKKDIDRDLEKYRQKCEKNRQNARKGGAPIGNANAKKTTERLKNNRTEKKQPYNDDDDDDYNDNDNDFFKKETNTGGGLSDDEVFKILEGEETGNDPDESKRKKVAPKKEKVTAFRPPTPEMVQQYCQQRQNGIDANEFVDFYTSKGWMVGKNKMKDWQAAVRTWEQSRKPVKPTTPIFTRNGTAKSAIPRNR